MVVGNFVRVRSVCIAMALGVCGAELHGSSQDENAAVFPQSVVCPMDEADWTDLIERDPFFEGHRHPLTDDEKYGIAHVQSLKDLPAQKVTRPVEGFPGDRLVMGTGWSATKASIVWQLGSKVPYVPEDCLTVYQVRALIDLGLLGDGGNPRAHADALFRKLYDDTCAGRLYLVIALGEAGELVRHLDIGVAQRLLTSVQQDPEGPAALCSESHTAFVGAFAKAIEAKRAAPQKPAHKASLEELASQWYTVDISTEIQPDLLGSVTSEAALASLPDHRFTLVYYEYVPWFVYLHPATLRIAGRVTKPGGTVAFCVHPSGLRLVAYMLHISKWRGDPQIANMLGRALGEDGFDVALCA